MKVFMTGGTGFVGRKLAEKLAQEGLEVTVLTRSASRIRSAPRGVSLLEGDPISQGPWQEKAASHEIVINLAGASIFTRWTDSAKREIRESRLLTTRNLIEALSVRREKETLFMSASAVGYYGFHGDEDLVEESAPGNDFLATLARDWEAAALEARTAGVRVVLCRFGVVLGEGGGALTKMIPLFRWGLGSPLGSGRQWFSWIHESDLAEICIFLIEHADISGPINFTAPNPVTNREMTRTLAEVLKRPCFLPPVPGFMIRLMMGEFGSVFLKGQKALPGRLLREGFEFRFPHLREALEDILARQ